MYVEEHDGRAVSTPGNRAAQTMPVARLMARAAQAEITTPHLDNHHDYVGRPFADPATSTDVTSSG